MLGLYYFRWTGTSEELKEYVGRVQEISDRIDGVNLKGVFAPSSEWNAVLLIDGANFEKILETYKTYLKKYGSHPKIPVAKLELLLTFEEIGNPV